jgi:hypothetical protein
MVAGRLELEVANEPLDAVILSFKISAVANVTEVSVKVIFDSRQKDIKEVTSNEKGPQLVSCQGVRT